MLRIDIGLTRVLKKMAQKYFELNPGQLIRMIKLLEKPKCMIVQGGKPGKKLEQS